MTNSPTAWDKPGSGPWVSAWATGSADGAPSQGYGQSSSQTAGGCCGHYWQLGAVHGRCVHLEESERDLKQGKKLILQGFFFCWLRRKSLNKKTGMDLPDPVPIAIRNERPVNSTFFSQY